MNKSSCRGKLRDYIRYKRDATTKGNYPCRLLVN